MGSRKRSARARQREEFEAGLGAAGLGAGVDAAFANERGRLDELAEQHEAALRHKACERKQRYDTRLDAERTARDCERHGSPKLSAYRCQYCGGWHLTHKQARH